MWQQHPLVVCCLQDLHTGLQLRSLAAHKSAWEGPYPGFPNLKTQGDPVSELVNSGTHLCWP